MSNTVRSRYNDTIKWTAAGAPSSKKKTNNKNPSQNVNFTL